MMADRRDMLATMPGGSPAARPARDAEIRQNLFAFDALAFETKEAA